MLTKWGKLYGSETGNMKSYGEIGANLKDINRKNKLQVFRFNKYD